MRTTGHGRRELRLHRRGGEQRHKKGKNQSIEREEEGPSFHLPKGRAVGSSERRRRSLLSQTCSNFARASRPGAAQQRILLGLMTAAIGRGCRTQQIEHDRGNFSGIIEGDGRIACGSDTMQEVRLPRCARAAAP